MITIKFEGTHKTSTWFVSGQCHEMAGAHPAIYLRCWLSLAGLLQEGNPTTFKTTKNI